MATPRQAPMAALAPGPYGKGYPRGKKTAAGRKAVWGVARPQGVEGLGMAGPHETLGSPWIPLPVRACG
jgi:hypothetical protein